MNDVMRAQVNAALIALKSLKNSIDLAAKEDDGVISKEEEREIKVIKKAIKRFEESMEALDR